MLNAYIMKQRIWTLVAMTVVLIFVNVAHGLTNDIVAISPDQAPAGTSSLSILLTLDSDNPPVPPVNIVPISAALGGIRARSILRIDPYTVSLVVDIPKNQPSGQLDVMVSFNTPSGNSLDFVMTEGFAVTEGESGTTGYNPAPGYNLFAPLGDKTTYLIDNSGKILHTWSSRYTPGNSVYLLSDGNLLRTANTRSADFKAGGTGGRVELLDWQSQLLWSYDYSTPLHRQHHDIEYLPNGNILMIAWELKTYDEAIAAGRNPALLSDGELWADHLIEVRPTGKTTGEIVWQWHIWDHLVQDYDSAQANYGDVADHPERVNLNYCLNENADWTHINAVNYNPQTDQIMLCVHNFSEIWIIDHSLSTEQAAGGAGDLLYRWGNPQAWGAGNAADQKLFVPHDAHWIPSGLPGEGEILVFNNGMGRLGGNYSSIEQIAPPLEEDGDFVQPTPRSPYGPDTSSWSYHTDSSFYAENISGVQRMTNGNTLICQGPDGLFFEITPEGQRVWQYNWDGAVFRVIRYSPGYAGIQSLLARLDGIEGQTYAIVDTSQTDCYDETAVIAPPVSGQDYYGQDAQFTNNPPVYMVSNDSLTVQDVVTGLVWTHSCDWNNDGDIDYDDKYTLNDARALANQLNQSEYGGYRDWRVPNIKELYSLMDFRGQDPSGYEGADTRGLIPFVDTRYFDFGYGDINAGERIIDAQFCSSTEYVSVVMNRQSAIFGLNFADGRIKGYPSTKLFYVYLVRGNRQYGTNQYVDNGDGTISDRATGLMWSQQDSQFGLSWPEALAWVQQLNQQHYLGYSDWVLPDAKQLQSILDYTQSPDTTERPALDPLFQSTGIINEAGQPDFPCYWTSTTHLSWSSTHRAATAVYVAFGRAMGYMNGTWMDVHGAGAQRSDPKVGDPADWPEGRGPQGDAIRIYNYVRPVRLSQCGDPGYVSTLPHDLNGDCRINLLDINLLSRSWPSADGNEIWIAMIQSWLEGNEFPSR